MRYFFYAIILFFLPVDVLASQPFTRSQILMGNVPVSITIKTSAGKKEKAYTAMEQAFNEARRIEDEVSNYKQSSQTNQVNRSGRFKWIAVGPDLFEILIVSVKAFDATQGAFDITYASSNRQATSRDIELDKEHRRVRLAKKGMTINLSSIAKGFIVDRMSDVLKKNGFDRHLVNAGDLFARGTWSIGLRNPDDPRGVPLCSFTVTNKAVSTSGTYERGHHIIDPKTRKPATAVKRVTVISDTSVWAGPMALGSLVLLSRPDGKTPAIPNVLYVQADRKHAKKCVVGSL